MNAHAQLSMSPEGVARNPETKTFSIERILEAIGVENVEASMMLFSLPAVLPVPETGVLRGAPTGIVAAQVAAGSRTIKLPKFLLKKCVPRKSLAIAIHAIIPVIEHAEKVLRPRWKWMSSGLPRRLLGLLVFVLAAAIAFPLLGFDPFHAASIFVISLGLAEKDGLAISIGVLAGVLSLMLVVISGVSGRILQSRVCARLRKLGRKIAAKLIAPVCDRLGLAWLARLIRFEWSQLLLLWDPEKTAVPSAPAAKRLRTANGSTARRTGKHHGASHSTRERAAGHRRPAAVAA